MIKTLFILKHRHYGSENYKSYGLINSAKQVASYLETIGYDCKIVTVIDQNFIDKEVYEFKPDIVILEAIWVTVEKIKELLAFKRYENIKWIIRIHSDMSFLSTESFAMKFINECVRLNNKNVILSLNNKEFNGILSNIINYKFIYLPNIISTKKFILKKEKRHDRAYINIGCFGAIRILKNQCFQALCAIKAAKNLHKRLKFYINADVDEDSPIIKNLKEMFEGTGNELIIINWLENSKFKQIIDKMDLGLQLSYTETFNLLSSDFVLENTPIIVSKVIYWMPFINKTSTTDYKKVVRKIIFFYKFRKNIVLCLWQHVYLNLYNKAAKRNWKSNLAKLIIY